MSFNIAYKKKNSYYIVIGKFICFIGFARFVFAETNKREENERFSSLFCCFLYFLKAKATCGATVVQKSVQNNQKYLLRNGRGHSAKMVDFLIKITH